MSASNIERLTTERLALVHRYMGEEIAEGETRAEAERIQPDEATPTSLPRLGQPQTAAPRLSAVFDHGPTSGTPLPRGRVRPRSPRAIESLQKFLHDHSELRWVLAAALLLVVVEWLVAPLLG